MGRASRKKAHLSEPVTSLKEEAIDRSVLKRQLVALLLLVVAAAGVFSNTFSVPFQFDDESNIIDNPIVHNFSYFLNFSGTRYVGFLTFAFNYHFGGLGVFGYH